MSGLILDRWLRGSTRALWVSQSSRLTQDARRDWQDLGGNPSDVISLKATGVDDEIPVDRGILFTTYALLARDAPHGKRSRLQQVVDWLAEGAAANDRAGFSGVIVFDEAHAMANAAGGSGRGQPAPSKQGQAGLRLQNALPDARVLYVSATGASAVSGLAYARRIGLWASGLTPFETRTDFLSAMAAGGTAALEVVARDLKALGLYQARQLSLEGVELAVLQHTLTKERRIHLGRRRRAETRRRRPPRSRTARCRGPSRGSDVQTSSFREALEDPERNVIVPSSGSTTGRMAAGAALYP